MKKLYLLSSLLLSIGLMAGTESAFAKGGGGRPHYGGGSYQNSRSGNRYGTHK